MASPENSAQLRAAVLGPPDLSASVAAAVAARELAARRLPVYLERLATLVDIDSGDDCPAGRERVAELLAEWAAAAGCSCEFVPTPGGGHLVARLPGAGARRIVLLGHHDTVFARGTAAARPFAQAGGRAFGPGVADMKGGLLVALLALEALAAGERPFAALELHSAPDEEVRTSSLPALPDVHGAAATLVFECGSGERRRRRGPQGRRLGALRGHRPAGARRDRARAGRNAVLALCRELLRSDGLNSGRPRPDGDRRHVRGRHHRQRGARARRGRARRARCVSATTCAGRSSGSPTCRATTGSGSTSRSRDPWPGIEPNPGTAAMFAAARRLAASLGFAVGGQTSGGVSDGCWTSADGVPTLDGFGPVGGLDHSADEYILLDSVAARCGLAAGLCDAVGRGLLDGRLAEGGGPKGSV